MLVIKNLHVNVEGSPVLKGLNLTVNRGEIHAIMGPNGAGKSTLAKVIAAHPAYEVVDGEILFKGEDLLEKEAEERAHLGVFMSFQYPVEVAGVANKQFLLAAYNAKLKAQGEKEITEDEFTSILDQKMQLVEMNPQFLQRNLNEGFSGGEKKRNEILQMALLDPKLAFLDETDSGLDIDAMRVIASGVNKVMNQDKALVLITHYQRLLDYIRPDHIHVMMDGKIVKSGGQELALQLEEQGYDWLEGATQC